MITVGFLASSFVGRNASGTAIQFRKIIEIFCADYIDMVSVFIFCNSYDQFNFLRSNSKYDSASVVMLPDVKGKFLRSSRQYFKYCFLKKRFTIDILHFSVPRFYPFFWKFPARKFICTFHAGGDVTASRDKFILSREIYNLIAKITHKKLNGIVAVSITGKYEISTSYDIPLKNIEVIYPGTDDLWNVELSQSRFLEEEKKIVVVIGRWQEYKNIQIVTKTLETLGYQDYNDMLFVFIGKRVSNFAAVIDSQLKSVSTDNYKCLDYVSNEEYVAWLRRADVVVFPSLNEGFGLPAFDAYGQGANLLIHDESPASEILKHESGVFKCNLRISGEFWKTLKLALENKNNSIDKRRFHLMEIGATWSCMASNYVKYYDKILKL